MDFLHAIFDLDGTLLDSMPVWETLGERYLQAHGKRALPGMRADTALLSMRQTADYFIERYGVPGTQQSVMDEINAMAADDYLHRVPAKPYVPEYLAHLKANGVNLCLATATDRPLVEGALKRLVFRPHLHLHGIRRGQRPPGHLLCRNGVLRRRAGKQHGL